MMKYLIGFFISFFLQIASASENLNLKLEHADVNYNNIDSIKRGAKFFAKNCMVCHTMIYLKYDKLAQETGILYDKMPINVKQWAFDVKPPDLSLEVSRRGADWVYTYLHSFYVDKNRPTGANNLLVENTVMPAILTPFQGEQVLIAKNQIPKKLYKTAFQWYDLVQLQLKGQMTPEEFDALTLDITNFLSYASEPYKKEQRTLGVFVLIFLFILLILVYLLKKSYWKKVER